MIFNFNPFILKKAIILIAVAAISSNIYSQAKKEKINSIVISAPVIWNNSGVNIYQVGGARNVIGNAISYGININYSRIIYKKIFAIVGIGYFKQNFGIERPFAYVTPDGSKPLIYTKSYSYNCLHLLGGIGYRESITKDLSFSGKFIFNKLNSGKQRYRQDYFPNINEVYKKSLSIGSMVTANVGIEKKVNGKFTIAADIILPVYTKWNSDEIFISNGYASDEKIIAKNRVSIGTAISCVYNF